MSLSSSETEDDNRKMAADKADKRRKRARKWRRLDIVKAVVIPFVHFLCLLAPFNFTWGGLWVAVVVYWVCGLGMTISYHRNLSHRSFKLPKWLEYFFAYCGLLATQGDPIDWVSNHRYHHQFTDTDRDPHSPKEGIWFSHLLWIFDSGYVIEKCGERTNVDDLQRQWYYKFLERTLLCHVVAFGLLLYYCGGLSFLTWGMGIGVAMEYHMTFLLASLGHLWGSRTWNTNDTSRNIWWLAVLSAGESWHNNHHAFETSARLGLEWWQIDISWYIIRFLEIIGLATDVKLPSETQRRRMALVR